MERGVATPPIEKKKLEGKKGRARREQSDQTKNKQRAAERIAVILELQVREVLLHIRRKDYRASGEALAE